MVILTEPQFAHITWDCSPVSNIEEVELMNAYCFNAEMEYTGVCHCQIDPIATRKAKKEVYLLPGNAIFEEPPPYNPQKEKLIWKGAAWAVETIPQVSEPESDNMPTQEDRLSALESAMLAMMEV